MVDEFAQAENAQVQRVDKATLDASLEAAKASDTTGAIAAQIPTFMRKLDLIEVLDLTMCPQEVKDKFIQTFDAIEDGNGYETLTMATDETDKVRIMAKRDESGISEILILALDTKDQEIAIVKMVGKLDESDIEDIIKQQTK